MSPTKIKAPVIKPVKKQPKPIQNPRLTQSPKAAKVLSQHRLRLPHAVSVLKKAFPPPVRRKKIPIITEMGIQQLIVFLEAQIE